VFVGPLLRHKGQEQKSHGHQILIEILLGAVTPAIQTTKL